MTKHELQRILKYLNHIESHYVREEDYCLMAESRACQDSITKELRIVVETEDNRSST